MIKVELTFGVSALGFYRRVHIVYIYFLFLAKANGKL